MTFSRLEALAALDRQEFDVLVLGGGIVGASVARDAAMRGLRTALVERRDFASGTSGRSSRLLHGGLRYLAQGRIGLVHEASVEKKVIHEIAPHLAAPLSFVFPTYKGNREWKLWQLKIGVKLYDLLCGGRNLGPSSWLNREEVLALAPGLETHNLQGGVRYYDGFTNDARLVLDTLRSAAHHGAVIVNDVRFIDASRQNHWECVVEDALTGQRKKVITRTVVNATGPWADGLPHSAVKLRLTKGIHVVVESHRLPVRETVVMTEGSRILFVIPWGERVIVGTTDTDYAGDPAQVAADEGDIDYILEVTARHFPQAKLGRADIISLWAGLRPLIADPSGQPSDISRSHEITNPEPHWWDVAGGKLTTCRLMAEQTVDKLIQAAALKALPCRTHETPLLKGLDTAYSGLVPPLVTREAVRHFCQQEWASRLEDVMIRRAGWHYYYADAAQIAEQVSLWMAEALDWSAEHREKELRSYQALIPKIHGATSRTQAHD